MSWLRVLPILVATVALSAPLQARPDDAANLRVAVVTAAPGEIYWQRFGHNAILVENIATGQAQMYNFGIFDFEQEHFLLNFVRGRMRYRLAAFPPHVDLEQYRAEGRTVWVQELNLTPSQRQSVATLLARHARPEHAEYRYDYFVRNCSTKVRDVLDTALDGRIEATMRTRARGETYRSLALAYARPEPWLALAIDLGLGPAADRRLSFWDEMFLPLRLRELLRDVRIRDESGVERPLVAREWIAIQGRLGDSVPARPRWFGPFLITGLALAMLAAWTLRARSGPLRRGGALLLALLTLGLGLGGLVLLGLWAFTDHTIADRNLNLVTFSPLALSLVWPIWRWRNPDSLPGAASRSCSIAIAMMALIGLGWQSLPGTQQANAHWFALLLPLHLAIAWRFWFARSSD